MFQRRLQLVSSNLKPANGNCSLSSVRPRMLRASLPLSLPQSLSPLLRKLQQLENASPAHAALLGEVIDEMLMKLQSSLVVLILLSLAACGGGNSSAPTAPTPTTPIVVSLSGSVSSSTGGLLSGALVTVTDGLNAGRSANTSNSGAYRIDNLTAANANVSAEANGHQSTVKGVYINGTNTLNFTLIPNPLPLFTKTGTGDSVFDMPTSVRRIHIVGTYTGYCSNFIVHIGSQYAVNEIIGTCTIGIGTRYDGTLLTLGGVVSITNSSGVSWSFEEVR